MRRRSRTVLALFTALACVMACGRGAPPPLDDDDDGAASAQAPAKVRPPSKGRGTSGPLASGTSRVLVPPEGDVPIYRASRPLMGTVFEIVVSGAEEAVAADAARRALDEVDRLEHVLSEWRPDSEISRVNDAAGREPVRVGPDLMRMVVESQAVSEWSDGAFDISWAALRGLWDFRPDRPHRPPSEADVRARLPLWSYRNVVVDRAASTLFLRRAGMAIGLGGIAKGYAVDRAGEVLLRAGLRNWMIYGGGQVLVHGRRGNRRWRVGIQHPRDAQRYFAFLEMDDGSLATSGDYEHSFEHGGRRYHHILDPRTGFPSYSSMSVTVVAPTGLAADAIDTAAFILGASRAVPRLARAPGGPVEAVFVDPELRLYTTPGTERRLIMRARLDADGRIGGPIAAGTDVPPLGPRPPPPEATPRPRAR
ncbi:MAG: FAD:protein FMN transferase [Deltaproteobacteria bacterium]|nr:FAD:protein FMN transferase [Deltaproteobacteria bacterium]